MGTELLVLLTIAGCYFLSIQAHSEEKRGPFYQWSGKRSESGELPLMYITDASKDSSLLKESFNPITSLETNNIKLGLLEKRGPFYQWSGKRAADTNLEEGVAQYAALNGISEKRGPFYQWSGKRNEESSRTKEEKRGPFYQWSGKRSESESEENNPEKRGPFYQWGGKRGPFYQWGGKRAEIESVENSVGKRGPFYQWSGKRTDMEEEKRGPFYQWSGKRSENEEQIEPRETETQAQHNSEQKKKH